MTVLVITQIMAAVTFLAALLTLALYPHGSADPHIVWATWAVWIAVSIAWGILCYRVLSPRTSLYA